MLGYPAGVTGYIFTSGAPGSCAAFRLSAAFSSASRSSTPGAVCPLISADEPVLADRLLQVCDKSHVDDLKDAML